MIVPVSAIATAQPVSTPAARSSSAADSGDLRHGPGQPVVSRLGGQRREILAGHRRSLAPVAGVEVHLAAAGLGRGELHLVAKPFEHGHHGLAGAGVQRVSQAGHEQADSHQRLRWPTLQDTFRAA
jgi:hypothetical protein